MAEPWRFWSAEQIATASQCPVGAVQDHWPRLIEQLAHCKINTRPTQAAMIGTVAIESASTFAPVREAFWLSESWRRANLRYWPYYGRGFIQLTWESNSRLYGPKIAELWNTDPSQPDFDLVGNPDNALEPNAAAAVAALYFRDHGREDGDGIPEAAARGDWREVRRLVQGGSAGLDRLEMIAGLLESKPTAPPDLDAYVFPVEGYKGPVNLHWGTFAGGSDIFADRGTPVRAIAPGTVVYRVEWSAIGGNAVQIDHAEDGLESYYAHGDRAPLVAMGQQVKAGDLLFGVGDSGNAAAAGPHLHFGMGEEILTGSGPSGGCGSDFDAVDFLRRLQAVAPKRPQTIEDQRDGLLVAVAHLADVVVPKAAQGGAAGQAAIAEANAIRVQFVGPKPA
jgi:murein DD-endopeptidase MepM/ murein hydrolase activator NlpD